MLYCYSSKEQLIEKKKRFKFIKNLKTFKKINKEKYESKSFIFNLIFCLRFDGTNYDDKFFNDRIQII